VNKMINIDIWYPIAEIEGDSYDLSNREGIIAFTKRVIKECKHSGETICLEQVDIVEDKNGLPQNNFIEIDRWH